MSRSSAPNASVNSDSESAPKWKFGNANPPSPRKLSTVRSVGVW